MQVARFQVSAIKSMAEICLMVSKGGAKFEEKLIFCFINDKNLVNFVLNFVFVGETMLAMHLIKITARSSFIRLRMIRQINRIH